MSTESIYSDLFAFGHKSIVWLRIFRPSGAAPLVLAIHPTDQPGAGPVNDAEALATSVAQRFPDLGAFRLLTRFPEDPSEEDEWIEIVLGADGPAEFSHLASAEVEALVGSPLPDPPDPTCAGIGGPGHPLLALLPPEEPEADPIDELVVIAVAELPFPHNPFRCRWKERFEQLRELYPDEGRERQVVGAHWSTTLRPEDLVACRYHEADWRRVADVSVQVLRELGAEGGLREAVLAVEERFGESSEAGWCRSLFVDPIVCHREPPGITDGQHRSCALRMSGAELCVVAGEDWYGTRPMPADPQGRAAATVSAFWAHRAAR